MHIMPSLEDLQKQIKSLTEENTALKAKIALLYNNWRYDYARFTELKEKERNSK